MERAQLDHADRVYRITREAFREFEGVLDPPSSLFLETLDDTVRAITTGEVAVAWRGDEIIGAVRLTPRRDHLYVGRLAVLPTCRQQGVATALIRYAEEIAQAYGVSLMTVEVRAVLTTNLAFFAGLGFKEVARHPHPRNPLADSVVMEKVVASETPPPGPRDMGRGIADY